MTLAPTPSENQLQADIDALRAQFPQTADLYREVCILLFFRHGITPTANKLYQLVRKGTMSTPAEALNQFWQDLREKSRVRIEHPDLPDGLKSAAGELTAKLWTMAQEQAYTSLVAFRQDSQTTVLAAEAALAAARTECDVVANALQETRDLLLKSNQQAEKRIETLDQQVAAVNALRASLDSQLAQARQDICVQQQRMEDARRESSAEVSALHAATQLAEERFRASETRSLLEIDRERTHSGKLQKELDAMREANNQSVERHRLEIAALQGQLGDVRQHYGALEGTLQVVTASRDAITIEVKTAQAQLAEAVTQSSLLRNDLERWQQQAAEYQRIATELQQQITAARTTRKAR
jgi:chromosome segregation ATPase